MRKNCNDFDRAALCLTGCGNADTVQKETEPFSQEQISQTDTSVENVTTVDYDVKKKLEDAEKEEEIKMAGDEFDGGSMAPMAASRRAAEITRKRVYELASYFGFEGTLLTFSIEGTEEIVPAYVFEGLQYTIAIPAEGWEMISRACWASEDNEKVQFWVKDYIGEDIDSVQEKLVNAGYEKIEYEPYSVRYEDEEGMVHQTRLFTENGETIGIFSCYPKETEKGFGARLRTIMNTFEWNIT